MRDPSQRKEKRYKGVTQRPSGKWTAEISRQGAKIHLGTFATDESAARAFDRAVIKFGGDKEKLNFPEDASNLPSPTAMATPPAAEQPRARKYITRKRKRSCPYRGVRKTSSGKWGVQMRVPDRDSKVWLGSFETAEAAARAYDEATFKKWGKNAVLNFPECITNSPPPTAGTLPPSPPPFSVERADSPPLQATQSTLAQIAATAPPLIPATPRPRSKKCETRKVRRSWPYTGVKENTSGKWDAQIKVRRQLIWLGSFTTAEAAARARDEAAFKKWGKRAVLNFPECFTISPPPTAGTLPPSPPLVSVERADSPPLQATQSAGLNISTPISLAPTAATTPSLVPAGPRPRAKQCETRKVRRFCLYKGVKETTSGKWDFAYTFPECFTNSPTSPPTTGIPPPSPPEFSVERTDSPPCQATQSPKVDISTPVSPPNAAAPPQLTSPSGYPQKHDCQIFGDIHFQKAVDLLDREFYASSSLVPENSSFV